MPHIVSAPCGMSSRRLAEKHLRSTDDETTRQLQDNLKRNNQSKLSDGTTKLPALIVTPDGARVSEQEERECQRLSNDLERFGKRLGPENYKTLMSLTNSLGPEALDVLRGVGSWAEQNTEKLSLAQSVVGGAASATSSRLDDFNKALAKYEDALNSYVLNKNSPAAKRSKLRENARRAFKELNGRFTSELDTMAKSQRYQSWVHNPYRSFAGGVESSFRSDGGLISSLPETLKLKHALTATRVVGKGVIAIDLVGRGYRVMNSSDWQYTLGRETVSFISSLTTAGIFIQGTVFVFALVGGPGGLVLLVSTAAIGGLAAYGGDAFGRLLFDSVTQPLVD